MELDNIKIQKPLGFEINHLSDKKWLISILYKLNKEIKEFKNAQFMLQSQIQKDKLNKLQILKKFQIHKQIKEGIQRNQIKQRIATVDQLDTECSRIKIEHNLRESITSSQYSKFYEESNVFCK